MDQSLPALSNLDLSNQVSIAVARKTLDAQQQEGAAAVQMIKAAAEIQAGQAEPAVKSGLDLYA